MMLAPSDLRVYWLRTRATENDYAHCLAMLSAEELRRKDAFLREAPRREFVIARATLRLLLGRALELSPTSVPILIGENGKPETTGYHFNLSHARGIVAVALTSEHPVGIDVEPWDDNVECVDIARQAFHPDDVERLRAASPEEQRQIFFDLWTRREALAKYLGVGISDPLAMRGQLPSTDIRIEPLLLSLRISAAVASHVTSSAAQCQETTLQMLLIQATRTS